MRVRAVRVVAIASQLWCENWKRVVMKRARGATSAGTSGSEPGAKRRKVKHDTYQKRLKQYDRECQTVTWLDCETSIDGGVKLVTKLKTPATRSSDAESSEEEDGEEADKLLLDDWDEWMQDVSDSD